MIRFEHCHTPDRHWMRLSQACRHGHRFNELEIDALYNLPSAV
jgi:hypothetical protein